MDKLDVLLDRNTLLVLILAVLSIFGVNKIVAIDMQALAEAIITIILAFVAIVKNRDAIIAKAELKEMIKARMD